MEKEFQAEYSPEAIKNLQEIIYYYTEEYPPAADQFLTALEETVGRIKENPYLYGVPTNFPELAILGYRKAPIYKHHLAFYRVDEENRIIYLICIVDSKQKIFLKNQVN